MKLKYIVILVVISTMFLIGGCTNVIRGYKTSSSNVNNIKEKYNKPGVEVNITSFTSSESENKSIMCRLEGPIKPPNEKSFEAYIADALISELKAAGIYSHESKKSINITFEEISFNSTVWMGNWIISSNLSTEDNYSFNVESEYEFSTSYAAAIACAQVSEAFPEAVETFIGKIITHPEFERIINANNP